jgi:hypothetical protein
MNDIDGLKLGMYPEEKPFYIPECLLRSS